MSGRGKPRTGIYNLGGDEPPSNEERRALLRALSGENVNRTHNRVALEEVEAEALQIIEDVYARHGLPTGPDARWKVYCRQKTGGEWRLWRPGGIGPGDEASLWSGLGLMSHGRTSEAGFASGIAAKLDLLHVAVDGVPVERSEEWVSAFLSGFRLAVSVAKWRWEFENRSMIDVSAPSGRSRGGRARSAAISAEASARHVSWQIAANAVWSKRPSLSANAVAVNIAKEFRASANSIRQVIKKPDE